MQGRWVWVAAVVLALSACTSSGGESASDGTSPFSPPGTKLPAGFVVAPGSKLVGPVFTYPSDDGHSISARAVVSIDDNPVGVYDRYAAQARELGIPMNASSCNPASACTGVRAPTGSVARSTDTPAPPDPTGACAVHTAVGEFPLGETVRPDAQWLTCYGAGVLTGGKASVTFEQSWGARAHHGLMTVWSDPIMGQVGAARGAPKTSTPPGLPAPSKQPLATEPGTPFGESNDAFDRGYRRFELEPGSRVVADVANVGGQFVTLLQIDGDAEQVMQGYAAQLGKGGEDDGAVPRVVRAHTTAGDVLMVENGPIGGGGATLITDPSGRWLLLQASSD